jgi:hypothetical protein
MVGGWQPDWAIHSPLSEQMHPPSSTTHSPRSYILAREDL